MKKEEMEKLVKEAYEGYLADETIGQKIVIDLNTFEDDEDRELFDLLLKTFEKNGYTIYNSGDTYAWDGGFETVNAESAVAILDNYELRHKTIEYAEDYLLNKEFTLEDLDNEAQEDLNSTTSLFDYDLERDILSEDKKTGSCSYMINNSDAEINIIFDVIELNEDNLETRVKVTELEAL